MEHLLDAALIGLMFGIMPIAGIAILAAVIFLICRLPLAGEGWRICVGSGLLASGGLNLLLALIGFVAWIGIAAGWWIPATPPNIGNYMVPIVTALNAGCCGAALWMLLLRAQSVNSPASNEPCQ